MVLGSCVRLLVRRLALRKSITLIIVCVTLLAALSLYYQHSNISQSNRDAPAAIVDIRKVSAVSKSSNANVGTTINVPISTIFY